MSLYAQQQYTFLPFWAILSPSLSKVRAEPLEVVAKVLGNGPEDKLHLHLPVICPW